MKRFPKKLISFRRLQGGQFGTLDVSAVSSDYVQLALGSDFVQTTRPQWVALRSMIDRFFDCESERVILTRDDGEPVLFEDVDASADDLEDIEPDEPPRPHRGRARSSARRRDFGG